MEQFRYKYDDPADNSAWILNQHKVLHWLQQFAWRNLRRFFNSFFFQPGIIYLGDQANLKVSNAQVSGGKLELTIEAGAGLVDDQEWIVVASQVVNNDNDTPADGTWWVSLRHTLTTDDDATYDVQRTPQSYGGINTRKYDDYDVVLSSSAPTGDAADKSLVLSQVTLSGGAVTNFTDERSQASLFGLPVAALNWMFTNYDQVDKDGTTATEFKIGVGTLGLNSNGLPVLTESADPADPLNLRIYDINPVAEEKNSKVADVTFRWGWSGLTGAHQGADGVNTLRITGVEAGSMALDVGADDLVGQRVYSSEFNSADDSYLIEGNLATSGGETVLTLEDSYADESVTESCYIIPDSDQVTVEVIPYIETTYHENKKSTRNTGLSYTIPPETTFRLPMERNGSAAQYKVRVKAYKGVNGASAWVSMEAGSYNPGAGQATVSYTVPFTCELPSLTDDGGITLTQTRTGFQVAVSGWKDDTDPTQTAHQLEIVRTTKDNITWNDYENNLHDLTENRIIDIPTTLRRKWQVGVRPIQNGQVVGVAKTGEVTSGAGGVAPGDVAIISDKEFDIQTYSGSITNVAPIADGYHAVTLGSAKWPATTANDANMYQMNAYLQKRTSILVDSNSNAYIIDGILGYDNGAGTIVLAVVGVSGNGADPAAGSFEINTSERGRTVVVNNSVSIEFDAVEGYIDWDIVRGADQANPAVLRVGQNTPTGKDYADNYTFHGNDGADTVATDFKIITAQGELSIFLDFYDESGTNNTACVKGRYSQYVRPRIKDFNEPEGPQAI